MALARLAEVPGQERAARVLSRVLGGEHLAHAYLFVGPSGTGTEQLAMALAQVLLCERALRADREAFACGHCPSCGKVERGTHPDLHTLRAEGAFIRVDQVRGLQKAIAFTPLESERRVCLLPDAHLLNVEAANALLKTLEEPPDHTYLLLTAPSPVSLLPTVVSRCQTIRCGGLTADALAGLPRADTSCPPGDVDLLAYISEGGYGQARVILEGEAMAWSRQLLDNLVRMDRRDPGPLFATASEMAMDRNRLAAAIAILRLWTRDALLFSLGLQQAVSDGGRWGRALERNPPVINEGPQNSLREWAKGLRLADLMAFASWLDRAEALVGRNVNRELIAEATLLFLLRRRRGRSRPG